MHWVELVIEVACEHALNLSDALMECGALSVSIADAADGTDYEKPLFGEPGMVLEVTAWEHSRVIALFASDVDYVAALQAACDMIYLAVVPSYVVQQLEDQDWVRLTQSQFSPMHIGKRIWVVPSWHDAPHKDALILELDPGLAFGTGSHPTTRLCMEWLEEHVSPGCSVLDYGCGSGILAILAKKLDAGVVCGVDLDPQAIQAAFDNAQRNHCVADYYLPKEFVAAVGNQTFDIVVANILSGPLADMARMLSERVSDGGMLVLSGILLDQVPDVVAAYAPFIKLTLWAQQDGWVALAGSH